MRMMSRNQLIFNELVYDLCPYEERVFCHKQIKGKLMFILQLAT